jgi:hypothetical protein
MKQKPMLALGLAAFMCAAATPGLADTKRDGWRKWPRWGYSHPTDYAPRTPLRSAPELGDFVGEPKDREITLFGNNRRAVVQQRRFNRD